MSRPRKLSPAADPDDFAVHMAADYARLPPDEQRALDDWFAGAEPLVDLLGSQSAPIAASKELGDGS